MQLDKAPCIYCEYFMATLSRNEGSDMNGEAKKSLKKLICVAILASVLANRANEAKEAIYYVNPGGSIQSVIDDPNVKADLSHDYFVDFKDYAILANDWLKTDPNLPGDINGDNIVDYNDLEILTRNWLKPNSKIAFTSKRDGNLEIYIMNPDGSEQTRLTYNGIRDMSPSWSPDNTKIVFFSGTTIYDEKIHIMNIDGSNRINLDSIGFAPAWSPDGSKIAFTSFRDGYYAVYIMNADGSNQRKLADYTFGTGPSWSPDGKKIVYSTGEIYIMNPDGTDKTLLAENPARPYIDPAWSPDGTKIAFVYGERYGMPPLPDWDAELFIMNADGSNQIRLTDNESYDAQPSWSPDSKKIAFMRGYRIIVIDIDSGNEINLTNGLIDSLPSWSSYFTK